MSAERVTDATDWQQAAGGKDRTGDDIIADTSRPTSERLAHLLNKHLHNYAVALPIARFLVRKRQQVIDVLTVEQIPTPHPVSPIDSPDARKIMGVDG